MKLSTMLVACVAFVGSLFAMQAKADVLIDPFLGYGLGNIKGSTSNDLDGSNYGLRLGYQNFGFMIGGEYALGTYTDKPSSGSSHGFDTTDAGIFVGYKFPILVRVYGTYYFDSTATESSVTSSTYAGTGYRLGVAFTGLPFIAIALEEIDHTYTKLGSNSITPNLDSNVTALEVTLPLTF